MIRQTPVNLNAYCNAWSATDNLSRSSAGLNAWGNSLPAEEVPFGHACDVGGIRFQITCRCSQGDHVETLGQSIELPASPPVRGVALLCLGEMGDQDAEMTLIGDAEVSFAVTAGGWLWPPANQEVANSIMFSHLHYPGDYELALLKPVLWMERREWSSPVHATRLYLGTNPLFHLFALSLLHHE